MSNDRLGDKMSIKIEELHIGQEVWQEVKPINNSLTDFQEV